MTAGLDTFDETAALQGQVAMRILRRRIAAAEGRTSCVHAPLGQAQGGLELVVRHGLIVVLPGEGALAFQAIMLQTQENLHLIQAPG